ncbi:MAG TPA: hypothetical protein VN372_05885 [Methanospirillum sp.]|nr:hypothetical protein [Methanospirillum sp.]
MKKNNILCFISILILWLSFLSPASGSAILGSSSSLSGPSATGSMELSIDSVPQGLSGYILTVTPENPEIVTITGATFPAWAAINDGSPGEGNRYTLRAGDLTDTIKPGATSVPLATLALAAKASGSTRILIEPKQFDDDVGNAITVSAASGSVTVGGGGDQNVDLILLPGWNLIAIPMTLKSGSDTAQIFRDVPSAGHSVFSYDPGAGWQTVGSDVVLSPMSAYWIFTEQQITITLKVQGKPTLSRMLSAGWSLLGIAGTTSVPAAQALASLSDWSYVIGFDSAIQQYKSPIIKGGTGGSSDQTPLIPGAGYWVYLNSPGELRP